MLKNVSNTFRQYNGQWRRFLGQSLTINYLKLKFDFFFTKKKLKSTYILVKHSQKYLTHIITKRIVKQSVTGNKWFPHDEVNWYLNWANITIDFRNQTTSVYFLLKMKTKRLLYRLDCEFWILYCPSQWSMIFCKIRINRYIKSKNNMISMYYKCIRGKLFSDTNLI